MKLKIDKCDIDSPVSLYHSLEVAEIASLFGGGTVPTPPPTSNDLTIPNTEWIQQLLQEFIAPPATGLSVIYSNTPILNAIAGNLYLLSNTSIVNLPEGQDGQSIGFIDYDGIFDTNNVQVLSALDQIVEADNLVLDSKYLAIQFVFYGGKWLITTLQTFEDYISNDELLINIPIVNNGRLAGTDAYNQTNVPNINTLYVVSSGGSLSLPIYNNSNIVQYTNGSSLSIDLTGLTNNTSYSVVINWNEGNPILELISWLDGQIEGGTTTFIKGYKLIDNKIVLGVIRTDDVGLVQDTPSQRFIYNLYNQAQKTLQLFSDVDILGDVNTNYHYHDSSAHVVEFLAQNNKLLVFEGSSLCSNNATISLTKGGGFTLLENIATQNESINPLMSQANVIVKGGDYFNGYNFVTLAIKGNAVGANFLNNSFGCINYYA